MGDAEHVEGTTRRFRSSLSKGLTIQTFNHQCLSRSKFFFNRDPAFLMSVTRELSIELFPPGASIITEGENGEKMYFLHRGEVEILVGPNQTKVATLSDGNVFGEMALFGSNRRAATVRATESCDCRVIHHRLFNQILKLYPAEQRFFQAMAAERLGQTSKAKQADENMLRSQSKEDSSDRPLNLTRSQNLTALAVAAKLAGGSRRRRLVLQSWAEQAKLEEELEKDAKKEESDGKKSEASGTTRHTPPLTARPPDSRLWSDASASSKTYHSEAPPDRQVNDDIGRAPFGCQVSDGRGSSGRWAERLASPPLASEESRPVASLQTPRAPWGGSGRESSGATTASAAPSRTVSKDLAPRRSQLATAVMEQRARSKGTDGTWRGQLSAMLAAPSPRMPPNVDHALPALHAPRAAPLKDAPNIDVVELAIRQRRLAPFT